MSEFKILIEIELNEKPSVVYEAWLDSDGHEQFTGAPANFTKLVGADFTAWDGYIFGEIIALVPNKRILQSWRTLEFDENTPDSMLDVTFTATDNGTLFTLSHTQLDSETAVAKYAAGWDEFYVQPMTEFYND